MLWIDRNAATGRVGDGELLEDPHAVQAAQPATARVLLTVDRRHAQLGGLAQHVDGEVLGGVPLQRVRRDALLGELGRRLGDHARVVVEAEVIHGKLQPYFIVGMENSAPSLMPDGQRCVTVLVLV